MYTHTLLLLGKTYNTNQFVKIDISPVEKYSSFQYVYFSNWRETVFLISLSEYLEMSGVILIKKCPRIRVLYILENYIELEYAEL